MGAGEVKPFKVPILIQRQNQVVFTQYMINRWGYDCLHWEIKQHPS